MRINGSLGYVTVANEGKRSRRIFVIPKGQTRIRTQMSAPIARWTSKRRSGPSRKSEKNTE
jgi:hypothetical protein